jgi:hypothetical protein
MKKYLILLFLSISVIASAEETVPEFEGIVTYSVKFVSKSKSVKVGKLAKSSGKMHLYYYKKGCHKWYSPKGDFEFEIYNPNVNPDVIVNKYYASDTLYYINTLDSAETVSKTTTHDKEVICDKLCRGVTFHLSNEKKKEVMRRTWYYPSSGLEFGKGRYTHYKLMGQDYLVNYCGSIPLRIVMDWPARTYYVIYEAVKIEKTTLDDSIFEVDKNAPVKYLDELN